MAQNMEALLAKAWVFEKNELLPEGTKAKASEVSMYIPFTNNKDTSETYTVVTFNSNHTINYTTHMNAETLKYYKMKPCGNGDSYVIESTWTLKKDLLIWYTKTGVRGFGPEETNETSYKYKIVAIDDRQLKIKLVDQKFKTNR